MAGQCGLVSQLLDCPKLRPRRCVGARFKARTRSRRAAYYGAVPAELSRVRLVIVRCRWVVPAVVRASPASAFTDRNHNGYLGHARSYALQLYYWCAVLQMMRFFRK